MKSDEAISCELSDEAATLRLGGEIGRLAPPGLLIRLLGELGAGKTTLVKGMLHGMGGDPAEAVSPTYTIVNVYKTPRGSLLHGDFYRLENAFHINDTGIYEALDERSAVVALEWADRIEMPQYPALTIVLQHLDKPERAPALSGGRRAIVSAGGSARDILEALKTVVENVWRTQF